MLKLPVGSVFGVPTFFESSVPGFFLGRKIRQKDKRRNIRGKRRTQIKQRNGTTKGKDVWREEAVTNTRKK
jgi:hypothetical protein